MSTRHLSYRSLRGIPKTLFHIGLTLCLAAAASNASADEESTPKDPKSCPPLLAAAPPRAAGDFLKSLGSQVKLRKAIDRNPSGTWMNDYWINSADDALISQHVTSFEKLLDPDEKKILAQYIQIDPTLGGYYASINDYLRKVVRDSKTIDPKSPDIDKFSHSIAKDAYLFDRMFDKTPFLPEGTYLFRGMALKDGDVTKLFKVGGVFKDAGFMSTSLEPRVAGDFVQSALNNRKSAFFLVLEIKGSEARGLITGNTEYEVILERNLKFETVSVTKKMGRIHYRSGTGSDVFQRAPYFLVHLKTTP